MLARKALAGTAGAPKLYVEDVMSCFLYTGNGSTQTITNNIDLSTEGGLVWTKKRATGADNNYLFDTARGTNKVLYSDLTNGSDTWANSLTAYNANGFSLGSGGPNTNADTYVSWTFRKAKKFFDVVTYTGDNTSSKAISHNLGSVPGCVIVKRTDSASHWFVWHRSTSGTPNNDYTLLNQTAATAVATDAWSSNAFTSTQFYVSNNLSTNVSGATYVAYLFAHDAGGFGDAGSDNVISCGSYTGNGSASGPTVTLGYEPQWVLVKRTDSTSNWTLSDNMRGQPVDGATAILNPNLSDAETSATTAVSPTATGFQVKTSGATFNANGGTYIYIAIRRGPMKTPTTGTSVFLPSTAGATTPFSVGFVPDMGWFRDKSITNNTTAVVRLTGAQRLRTNLTNAESLGGAIGWDANTNFWYQNDTGGNLINWLFRRAPGFFDVVCYTGNGSTQNVSHNLGVAPELIIAKSRSASGSDWWVYAAPLTTPQDKYLRLQSTDGESTVSGLWGSSLPTSTTFGLGAFAPNTNAATFVAYLFASLSGVSKIGTYTGNGSSVTVTTNFQPRFILVKRTDSTGNWIVGDSARGLVSADEPALFLNSTAAETTGQDWVDVSSTGFTVNETALNANVNTATYIYLCVA